MKILLAIAFFLLPGAALAADEPEVVYGKFHRAAMAGELDEMLKYGPAGRRAEIQGMSAAHREAALKMAQFMMPRAFTLERKTVHSNGRATLVVSGPGDSGGGALSKIYGTVAMLNERGEWKVDQANWSTEKPAELTAPKPAPQAASKPAAKPAPGAGSMTAPIGGKLSDAKPECVYKPVMTAQDMENCK